MALEIDPLPPAPSRGDDAQDFADKADAFVSAMDPFGQQANSLAAEAENNATSAEEDAASAFNSALSSASNANYIGPWSALSGDLNIPASVENNGVIWILKNNIPDVTASEPTDNNTDWVNAIDSEVILSGLVISNGTDSDHDINISKGKSRDYNDSVNMSLTSIMTKQIDAIWVAGTNQGGLFSGVVAADTWYYVFLIKKDSAGSIDVGFDISSIAVNIPAGYTAFRRVGQVLTDSSANILGFSTREVAGGSVHYNWDIQSNDIAASSAPTVSTPLTLQAAPGSEARFNLLYANNAAAYARLSEVGKPDVVPSISNFNVQTSSTDNRAVGEFVVAVDSASQILTRATAAGSAWFINTTGYMDRRID